MCYRYDLRVAKRERERRRRDQDFETMRTDGRIITGAHLLCAGLDQVWREHISERKKRDDIELR